ncbi:MAG: acylphosphatase [Chloroflexi bacterium]|nr:acylphosphatase [Chloroflexota bacterium]MDA1003805.1 acylphosphatase [Chloroflexota bacterium]
MAGPRRKQMQIVALARGRVQGVGYRAFCADIAVRLNVEGYAKNLPDGRVEVVGESDEATLRQFVEQLREGPAMSRVENVSYRWEEPTGEYRGFEAII